MRAESKGPDLSALLDELWAKTQDAFALFAAVQEDVFSLLRTPREAGSVSAAKGWDPRATRVFLDALAAMGLVERCGTGYQNADIAERCLVPGCEDDQTAIIRHRANSLPGWMEVRAALQRGGASARPDEAERSDEELWDFICGMENIARTSAKMLWDLVDLSGRRAIVDLGGGPGTYALEALSRFGKIRAAVLDRGPVIEIARDQAAKADLLERMVFIPGDLTADVLPGGYDVHLLSNVVHMLGRQEVQDLFGRSAKALEPGGVLIVKDFMPDEDRTGPPFALRFALHMLVQTPAGDCYTPGELGTWLREAGLEPFDVIELTAQTRVLLASKPA